MYTPNGRTPGSDFSGLGWLGVTDAYAYGIQQPCSTRTPTLQTKDTAHAAAMIAQIVVCFSLHASPVAQRLGSSTTQQESKRVPVA